MLELKFELQAKWPKLAWVAVLTRDNDSIKILHGHMVEVHKDWAVEGVWDAPFENGDFDQSDLIFGSGVRKRGDCLIFVSSTSGSDRLWFCENDNRFYVSNTLPGLLSVADLSLQDDYENYPSDIASIKMKGLNSYVPKIPSSGPDISIVYFQNLTWSLGDLSITDKPINTPDFEDFSSYENFLKDTAEKLGSNVRSKYRNHQVDMMVGISSGYDSVASAVVSQYSGCSKAVTIAGSSSLWRGSDSGEKIAARLGFTCQVVEHKKSNYKHETSIWAAAGRPGGRNFTLFDYPKPLCLFFSGVYGDKVWDITKKGDLNNPMGDVDALLCETRLIVGFFVTCVPWWGIKKAKQIQKINLLPEMRPWSVGTSYDRPIARRIVEEAGIKRGTFAIRKKDTASNEAFWWPSSQESQDSLRCYLSRKKIAIPSNLSIKIYSNLSNFLNFAYKNTAKRFGIKKWWRPWLKFPCRQKLFIWANDTLRCQYFGRNE